MTQTSASDTGQIISDNGLERVGCHNVLHKTLVE